MAKQPPQRSVDQEPWGCCSRKVELGLVSLCYLFALWKNLDCPGQGPSEGDEKRLGLYQHPGCNIQPQDIDWLDLGGVLTCVSTICGMLQSRRKNLRVGFLAVERSGGSGSLMYACISAFGLNIFPIWSSDLYNIAIYNIWSYMELLCLFNQTGIAMSPSWNNLVISNLCNIITTMWYSHN